MTKLGERISDSWIEHAPLYPLEWLLGSAAMKLMGSEVYGKHHIPVDDPFVLALTHHDSWDAVGAGAVLPFRRQLRFMGKSQFFTSNISTDSSSRILNSTADIASSVVSKAKSAFWYGSGAFPVDRESQDFGVINKAVKLLNSGNVVGIAPEGYIHKGYEVTDLNPGAFLIALAANVKILPVAIAGRQDLPAYIPRRLVTVIGEPIAEANLPENIRDISGFKSWHDLSKELIHQVKTAKIQTKHELQELLDQAWEIRSDDRQHQDF